MVTTALMQFDVWHTECINPVQWSAVTRHLVQVLSLLVLSLCVYMKIDSLLDSVGATRVDASHALYQKKKKEKKKRVTLHNYFT